MNNPLFWKAIQLLSRPATLAAIGVLLINDHLLRRLWPSWLTGKVGDLAWLFFAPFVLVAILAWLVPPRDPRRDKVVQGLAYGLTGGVFVLANTLPGFNAWLLRAAETLLGLPLSLRSDVTDLLALPALALSWRFWRRATVQPTTSLAPGWIALSAGALLTIANAAVSDYGIACLEANAQQVTASSALHTYISADGGLTWELAPGPTAEYCDTEGAAALLASDTPEMELWRNELNAPAARQAERAYYEKTRGGNVAVTAGPLDVVTDPGSGNVIFAMGHEGALVRTAAEKWRWVVVGPYRRASLRQVSEVYALLSGEALLAVAFGLLTASTLAQRLRRSLLRRLLLIAAWGMWAANLVLFPPALTTGYGAIVMYPLMIVTLLLAGALAVDAAIRTYPAHRNTLFRLIGTGVAGVLAVAFPFVLWVCGSVTNYSIATLLALALGAVTLFAGARSVRAPLDTTAGVPA